MPLINKGVSPLVRIPAVTLLLLLTLATPVALATVVRLLCLLPCTCYACYMLARPWFHSFATLKTLVMLVLAAVLAYNLRTSVVLVSYIILERVQ